MGSGIALLLWTAKLLSPFLFLYHRYVSILKYNTAGVCLAIKKAMPVNEHRLFDHERTRCKGDDGKIGSPYRQPSPRGEGLGGATLRVDFYKGALPEDRWITGFPFMVSDTIRFTANNKDVSLALEMTTRESDVPHSLAAPNPQPLIPSY